MIFQPFGRFSPRTLSARVNTGLRWPTPVDEMTAWAFHGTVRGPVFLLGAKRRGDLPGPCARFGRLPRFASNNDSSRGRAR